MRARNTAPMRRLPVLALIALAGCGGDDTVQGPAPSAPARIRLQSPAFAQRTAIPRRFTCDGASVSPPLRWSRVPSRARGLALLMEDPDAPGGTFVHWVVVGIPPSARSLPEGRLPSHATATKQSAGKKGYGAPCPPEGDPAHRYVLSLYALDRPLRLGAGASPEDARDAISEAAIARGTLKATYGR
jgi:Raf kinase inhibitor-like YbhB/YbcL family protein